MQTEFEGSFKMVTPSGYTRNDIMLIILGCDKDKVIQNNWRKMHSLPMKRRKAYGT